MKDEELKKLIIGSLDANADPSSVSEQLADEGLSYDFREGFSEKVLNKIFVAGKVIDREVDFVRNLNFVFSRIALTGVAAILILLISILIAEGSLSMNSFLGLGSVNDESLVYLLTGN
jgi:hypothetical protein